MERSGLELVAEGADTFMRDMDAAGRSIDNFVGNAEGGAGGLDGFGRAAAGASTEVNGLSTVAAGAAGVLGGVLLAGIAAVGSGLLEVSEKAAVVKRSLGELGNAEMGAVLNDAALLEARYGVELPEAVGAASTLMSEFGLTSDEAMAFIVSGFDKGLNASGDFLDSIGEYANLYADNGFAADEFFSSMQTGLAGGVLGTDKAADAFKEFGIRIQELGDDVWGPDGAMRHDLGMTDEEITTLFEGMRDGSVTVADVYDTIIPKLRAMDDPIAQNTVGVKLFGTQWEDLGAEAILAIDTTMTGMDDMATSADESRGRIESLGEIWPRIWGGFVAALAPANEAILNFINALGGDTEALAALPGWAQELVGAVQGIPGAIDGAKQSVDAFFNTPLGTMLKDGAADVAGYFSGEFQTDLNNGIALAEAGLNRIAESDFGQRLQRGAGVVANYFVNEWPADFQNGIALVEGYLAPLAPEAERIFTDTKEGASLVASYILDEWPTDFQNGVDLVVDFVTKLPERAQTAFDDFKTALTELPGQLTTEAEAIGSAIVDGIADGIGNAADRAIQAARDLASGLPEWVKKTLGIASPSKVFADEVGMPISQGIAQGILDGVDVALSAAETLGDDVLRELTTMAEQARAILDDVFEGQIGLTRGRAGGLRLLDDANADITKASQDRAKAEADIAKVMAEQARVRRESEAEIAALMAERAQLEVTAAQNIDPAKRAAAAEKLAEIDREIAERRLADTERLAELDRRLVDEHEALAAAQERYNEASARSVRLAQQLAAAQSRADEIARLDPQEAARFLELRQRQIAELAGLQEQFDSASDQVTRSLLADQIALIRQAQDAELRQFSIESERRLAEIASLGAMASVSPIASAGAAGGTSYATTSNSISISGVNMTEAQLVRIINQVLDGRAARAGTTARMT